MKHADLISRSIEKSSRRLLQQALGLMLTVLLLTGCGGATIEPTVTLTPIPPTATPIPPTATPIPPTATPIPTTGSIAGMVLGDDRKPLLDANDPDIMIVALFCSSDDSDIECLDQGFWEMDQDALLNSICEADDTSSNCLLHFGRGATFVEADGSYIIADLSPGQYNIVFFFPAFTLLAAEYDLSVQAGEITEHDFIMEFHRSN